MTIGRVGEGPERKFCAVLRDITAFEEDRGRAASRPSAPPRRRSAQKSEFLAKISHEIRTPLNAIIGFAEVMMEERFGPIGNERYSDYLRDIHASGEPCHQPGQRPPRPRQDRGRAARARLHERRPQRARRECVALMQPQAARERIIMRTALRAGCPRRRRRASVRQIILNLVVQRDQVHRSRRPGDRLDRASTERGEVVIRVRDTGVGMTREEVEAAMQPFRQVADGPPRRRHRPRPAADQGAGRGEPGRLEDDERRDEGTLVEVLFPPTRVLCRLKISR